MQTTLIRASEQPSVAWKNGGGQTRQLLCWPPGADMANFRWRLSVAQIERDGPFSAFPGYRRSLLLLAGAGMDLDFADRRIRVDAAHPRIDFAGAEALHCRLLAGPTADFNLIIADHEQGAVLAPTMLSGRWSAPADGGLQALYLCRGSAETALGSMQPGDLLYGSELRLSGVGVALQLRLPL